MIKAVRFSALLISLLCLSRCATYKELLPEPLPIPAEQGSLDLKKGEKQLEVSQGKKYYVAFPAPTEKSFYLVLDVNGNRNIRSSLTSEFDLKNVAGTRIPSEPLDPALQVYPVDANQARYFWIIDTVMSDHALTVKYRYVPQWRFRFETRHAQFLDILKKNMVNRTGYQGIGVTTQFDDFRFDKVVDSVTRHFNELKKVHVELLAIQSIFPSAILKSQDKAYLNYLGLKKELEEEMAFQESWLLVMDFFKQELECRKNPLGFLDRVNVFTAYFEGKEKLTQAVIQNSRTVMERRLSEIQPFYDLNLSAKTDVMPLDSTAFRLAAFNRLPHLYDAAGIPMPAEFRELLKFVGSFDNRSHGLIAAKDVVRSVMQIVKEAKPYPGDALFAGISANMAAALADAPMPDDSSALRYTAMPCAVKLKEELDKFRAEVGRRTSVYRAADTLVKAVNSEKARGDYPAMAAMLKIRPDLNFLYPLYPDLDAKSIETQGKAVKTALDAMDWAGAETRLVKLAQDGNFLVPAAAAALKATAIDALEDALYNRIDKATRERVDQFCEARAGQLENVDSLYTDSVFLPVYDVTFSSGTRADLGQKKADMVAHLARLKENEFPAKAIKLLYDAFIRSPDDSGVLKCRAIVAHGRHFTGTDKDITKRVSECDPEIAKWIVKPVDYRRLFVLPVTDNRTGKNTYLMRLNIRVDSDAKFPVFDVNIKLPREVAQNAADAQWYDKMTLNGKPLKNEGRFSITAPTAASNWECQITPVQMAKDADNILEITFQHRSFKAFSSSVMVQKPLIKKN